MARKKAPSPPPQVLVMQPPVSEQEDEDKSVQEQEVDAIMEQVDSEVLTKLEARIFRRHPATGNRESHTDTIDAELLSGDFLRDNYGGGSYRVQIIGPMRGKAGKPGRGIVKSLRFEIDASIPPKHPRSQAQGAAPNDAGQPNNPGSTSLDMAVVSMLATMMQQMQAASNAQSQSQQSLMAMQMQMMKDHSTMLQAQLAALMDKKPERDPLEVAERLASLIKPEPQRSVREELETLQLLKELTGDGNSGETSWLDVVKEVGPSLLQAAARKDGLPGRPPKGVVPAPSPDAIPPRIEGPTGVAVGAGEAASQGGEVEVNPSLKFVAPIVPKLVKWATQGRSPELCAEWQLSEIPVGFYPMLREQLGSPTLLDDVKDAFPATAPFLPWVDEFRKAMLDQMSPDEEGSEHDDDADEEEVVE